MYDGFFAKFLVPVKFGVSLGRFFINPVIEEPDLANIQNRILAKNPFVRIIIPAAAGLIAAAFIPIPFAAALVCCLIVWASAFVFRGKGDGVYVWLAIMFFFFMVAVARKPHTELPAGERVAATAQILEKPYTKGRWMNTTAHVGYYRPAPPAGRAKDALPENVPAISGDLHAGTSASPDVSHAPAFRDIRDAFPGDGWIRADEPVMLAIDTCYGNITPGTQLAFKAWVNPVDTAGTSYGNLMKARGIHNKMYLVPGNMVKMTGHVSHTPRYYSALLQSGAVRKLERLDMDPESLSVVSAMTAGDKRGLEPGLRGQYNSSGAAHLLAVSGLHVGIVFILINIFLYFLPAARRGHIVRNAVAIAAIWFYAFAAGFSPSVIRAALMFSFAQLALASGSSKNAMNIMLGSAVIMLAVNPNYIYEPGFLMSYAAVFAIIAFFNPVYSLLKTKYKPLNVLVSVMIVGLVASVGVAPLVSYFFGRVSFAGIIINPAVVLTAHIIVMSGVLWLLMPFGFGFPVFSWVLGKTAALQNALVGWSARREWMAFDGEMPLWGVVLSYILLICAGAVLNVYKDKKAKSSLSLPLQ